MICISYLPTLALIGVVTVSVCLFLFQAEDGIRYLVRSRGLGDVYKRQFQHGADCPQAGAAQDEQLEIRCPALHDPEERGVVLFIIVKAHEAGGHDALDIPGVEKFVRQQSQDLLAIFPVSYTHLRAHETVLDLVCRLLLEKKK